MNDATEYPKRMVHPGYQKGTVKEIHGVDAVSGRKFLDYQGTPDRYPPVDVINHDIEAQYRAKGYLAFGEAGGGSINYREYPKMLVHPDHVPPAQAIAAVLNGANQVLSPEVPAKAAVWPDIAVANPQEEAAAIAKGYLAPGKPDPDAMQAAISSPYDPSRVTEEYPKMVNGALVEDPAIQGGPQQYPKWVNLPDHPHGGKEVRNRAEEDALLGRPSAPPVATASPGPPVGESKFQRAQRLKAEAEAAMAAAEAEMAEEDAPEPEVSPPPAEPTPSPETPPGVENPPAVQEPATTTDRQALYTQLEARGIAYSNRWPTPKLVAALQEQAA